MPQCNSCWKIPFWPCYSCLAGQECVGGQVHAGRELALEMKAPGKPGKHQDGGLVVQRWNLLVKISNDGVGKYILMIKFPRNHFTLFVVITSLQDRPRPVSQKLLSGSLHPNLRLLALGIEKYNLAYAAAQ